VRDQGRRAHFPQHARVRDRGLVCVFDAGCVNTFLATSLSRVMRVTGPIPAVSNASVLHSVTVGGFVVGNVGPL